MIKFEKLNSGYIVTFNNTRYLLLIKNFKAYNEYIRITGDYPDPIGFGIKLS